MRIGGSRVVRFAVLMILAAAAMVARADDSAQKIDLALTAVTRDLGMYDTIRDIPQMLNDGLTQQRSEHPLSESEKLQQQRVTKVLTEKFSEREIMNRIRAELAKSYDSSRYATLQRLLQSPIARKVVQLKHDALSDVAIEEVRRIAREYDEKKQDKERLTILRQIDDASADTEFFVAAQALSIYVLSRMREPGDGGDQRGADELLMQSYEQLIRPSRFTTTMTYLYAFKAQSTDDLRQFLDLYSFADVQWFLAKFMDSLRSVVLQMTREAEQQIAPVREPSR